MNPTSLQPIALTVAQERSFEIVLRKIVEGLALQPGVALARVWLIAPGDICETCPMSRECALRTHCLHLAASAGYSRAEGTDEWSRLDGAFRRFPLGARKVGGIGATGSPLLLNDAGGASFWARPEWVRREGIRSFAGQPLIFRGEILGVLAVFSRRTLDGEEFAWLRAFADHAAVAIANGRAFDEIERLREKLEIENGYLREEVREALVADGIVGESAALRKVLQQIDLVAPTGAGVLILGESGTGKELVARRIHERSPRRHRPLIKVNCASIPRDLFESEFFGHARGAFTGALKDRAGRFQAADGGTLFLDEVGEIPLELQGKLLRAIQEGQFERVGEEATRRVDVRIIAATNRDLESEVEAGRFRRDLYYRLSVFPIDVPSLRERPEDIPPLADHFVRLARKRLKLPGIRLTEVQVESLKRYDWPGNVRELQNVIERAAIVGRNGALSLDLPAPGKTTGGPPRAARDEAGARGGAAVIPHAELRRRERENIVAALARTRGKIYGPGGAAELLGIRPTTLASRIQAMGIRGPRRGAALRSSEEAAEDLPSLRTGYAS